MKFKSLFFNIFTLVLITLASGCDRQPSGVKEENQTSSSLTQSSSSTSRSSSSTSSIIVVTNLSFEISEAGKPSGWSNGTEYGTTQKAFEKWHITNISSDGTNGLFLSFNNNSTKYATIWHKEYLSTQPQEYYEFSFKTKSLNTTKTPGLLAYVKFVDNAYNFKANVYGDQFLITNSNWDKVYVIAKAPDEGYFARLLIQGNKNTEGEIVVDELCLRKVKDFDKQAPEFLINCSTNFNFDNGVALSFTNASMDNYGLDRLEVSIIGKSKSNSQTYSLYSKVGITNTNFVAQFSSFDGISGGEEHSLQFTLYDMAGNSISTNIVVKFMGENITWSFWERFTNTGMSSSYKNGNFTGVDGSTWEYVSNMVQTSVAIDHPSPIIRNNPVAYLRSGVITNGIGKFTFKYMQPYSTALNFFVYVVNENMTVTNWQTNIVHTSDQGTIKVFGPVNLNISDNFRIIWQQNTGGQICIDDVKWTVYP